MRPLAGVACVKAARTTLAVGTLLHDPARDTITRLQVDLAERASSHLPRGAITNKSESSAAYRCRRIDHFAHVVRYTNNGGEGGGAGS